MAYVKAPNGTVETYPYSVGHLRRDNPNTSFPKTIPEATLAAWDVFPVSVADQPSYDERTQKIAQNAAPTLSDGSWTIGWTVSSKTAEEVTEYDNNAASANRRKRDALLAQTDWVVIMHTEKGTNIPADMELYRQALRDITSHANWPNLSDSDWPVKP